MPGLIGRLLAGICDKLALIAPELFAFQYLVVCRPKPGVKQLLLRSQRYLLGEGMFKESAEEHALARSFVDFLECECYQQSRCLMPILNRYLSSCSQGVRFAAVTVFISVAASGLRCRESAKHRT